jgi:hypothetical protein
MQFKHMDLRKHTLTVRLAAPILKQQHVLMHYVIRGSIACFANIHLESDAED